MRNILHAILIPILLITASCAKSTKDVSGLTKPLLAQIPPEYFEACRRPKTVPDGVTVGELIKALNEDADKLNECADRHEVLGQAVKLRDSIQTQQEGQTNDN